MKIFGSVAALAGLLAAAPAHAFDATGADILGLRLGMVKTEVEATLRRQGFAVAYDHGILTANTRDGRLTIEVDQAQDVKVIQYAFTGHGVGEQEKIEVSVLDRFGPAAQREPMMWCRKVADNGKCPIEESSLTFHLDTLTLTLQSGSSRQR